MGLILTLLLGIFIVVGAVIVFVTKNNDKFVQFSISLAFSVMLMLLAIDLVPEAYEVIDTGKITILTAFFHNPLYSLSAKLFYTRQ